MEEKNPISLNTAEKMIRIEQNVSATFGKYLPYDKTDFYKKLSAEEKKNLQKYMENKKKKRFFGLFGLVFIALLFSLLKFNFTGNVVNEAIGTETSNILGWVFIVIFVVGLIVFLFKHNQSKKFDAKALDHSKVMYDLFAKKI